jgi:hypothetical protein
MPKFNSPPDISKFMAIGDLCRNSSTSQGWFSSLGDWWFTEGTLKFYRGCYGHLNPCALSINGTLQWRSLELGAGQVYFISLWKD